MRTAYTSLVIAGALVALAGRTSLHAQPAPAPTADIKPTELAVTAGEATAPWSRGVAPAVREEARGLFLEGNRLFTVPLFARAAEKYALAIARWKHPAFYFNLALAQLNLGQDVEARASLAQALAHGDAPLGTEQFEIARKQLQELESQLGRIRVRCETPGAEVTLDGVPLFTGPGSYEGWVTAKPHELTAKKPGYLPEARRVAVAARQLHALELKLVTLSEATDTSRRWAQWKPWTVVASGAALAAAGGALHALSARSFNRYDADFLQLPCVTMPDAMSPGCAPDDIPQSLNDRLDRARLQQNLAVAGYIAGGAVIATGVVLLYMNRPQIREQKPATEPVRGVAIVPTVSPDGFGVLVTVQR